MAELYRIENETLTSMADKIRILNGSDGTMTTAQMVSSLDEANTEVATQTTLISEQDAKIAELAEILSSKASGGSDGGIETCTVDLASPFDWELEHLLYSNGNELVDFYPNNAYDRISLTVAKNTMLFINLVGELTDDPIIVGDAEMIYGGNFYSVCLFSINGDCSINP